MLVLAFFNLRPKRRFGTLLQKLQRPDKNLAFHSTSVVVNAGGKRSLNRQEVFVSPPVSSCSAVVKVRYRAIRELLDG